MLIQCLAIFLSAFFLGLLFISLLRRPLLKLKTSPGTGIPLIGGTAIILAFALTSWAVLYGQGRLSREAIGIMVASGLMLLFGIADDWLELSVLAKISVQAVAACLLIALGVRTQIVYIGDIANAAITLVWVIGITNAFNHLDIIDGLAGGAALIAGLAFCLIAFMNRDAHTALLALSLSGAVFSFLLYNLPPARIYMGNAGSHALGFTLAAIALVISYAPLERKVALLSPLFILGLPIFDTAFLILMRLSHGRSIFRKSNDHFALRFIKQGRSRKNTLLWILGLAAFFAFCGISLSRTSNLQGISIIISAVALSLFLAHRMSKVSVDA